MEKMSAGAKMRRVRAQAMLLHRLGDQLRALEPGVKSPVLTGMPAAPGRAVYGLDAKLARKDALERILVREGALMRSYEREARAEMDRMKPEVYAFCALYYLSALPLEEVAATLDRSKRQCIRYKKEIEEETEEAEEAEQNVTKCHLAKA